LPFDILWYNYNYYLKVAFKSKILKISNLIYRVFLILSFLFLVSFAWAETKDFSLNENQENFLVIRSQEELYQIIPGDFLFPLKLDEESLKKMAEEKVLVGSM
jgi:hypothetical protein